MRLQWRRLEVWEDLSYSSQLFLGEGSGEFVLVGGVRSDILLGAKFSRLVVGDKLRIKLGPEDTLRGAEVVVVGVIGHGRSVSVGGSGCERDGRTLARHPCPYMSSFVGP